MRRVRTTAAATSLACAVALPAVAAPAGRAAPAGASASALAASPLVSLPAGLTAGADPAVGVRASYACTDPTISRRATCAYVNVPLDHAKPRGRKIKIAISVIKATAPLNEIHGVLVVHPGGPGAPGLGLAGVIADALPAAEAARWNIVGLDLRGINGSVPRLTCDPDFKRGPRPDYVPTTGAKGPVSPNEKKWLAKWKAYAKACGKKYADLLPHLTTRDYAEDLDVLRRGLGVNKLSLWTFSYGTYLGMTYATMYPTHVDRMIFDGVVDPRRVWYRNQLDQDKAFEVTITRFFGWVAANDRTYGLGRTGAAVRARYAAEQGKLRRKPVGQVGPAEWTDVFLRAAYDPKLWPSIARAFQVWVAGVRTGIEKWWAERAQLEYGDTLVVTYLAATCTDAPWPRDYATWRKDGFATAAKAPFETWGNLWDAGGCLFWPVKGGTPPRIGRAKLPPFLLTGTTLDPATPYAGALEARRRFPSARLVAEQGGVSHTVSLTGNPCVSHYVADYLFNGHLPKRKPGGAADVTCTRKADPKP